MKSDLFDKVTEKEKRSSADALPTCPGARSTGTPARRLPGTLARRRHGIDARHSVGVVVSRVVALTAWPVP